MIMARTATAVRPPMAYRRAGADVSRARACRTAQAASQGANRRKPGSTAGTRRRLPRGWSKEMPGRYRNSVIDQVRTRNTPSHSWLCPRSEEHTSELQSHSDLVCRLLLEKKKTPRGYLKHNLQAVWICNSEGVNRSS